MTKKNSAAPCIPPPACQVPPSQGPVPALHAIGAVASDSAIAPAYHVQSARYCAMARKMVRDIDIFLRNHGTRPARMPFLGIPSLGLNLAAAKGWKKQDAVLGRRMKLFTAPENTVLEADEARHCCTLILYARPGSGGYVGYVERNEYRLSELPDLDLACAVGAVNLPTVRLPFHISADVLRMAIGGYSLIPRWNSVGQPDVWALMSQMPLVR